MPKKKINNRLNKLFDNIKSNEPPAQPRQATKTPLQTAPLDPDSVPADLVQPQAAHAVIASAPVSIVQKSDAAVLSLGFQPRENDWATLRVLDETTNSRVWSEDDRLLVRQVTDQLSLALENSRLFQETQQRAAQLQGVSEISSAVSTILNPQELLDTFVYLTRQRYNLYHTHIFMLEDDNHTLDVKACGWQDESLHGTHETRTIDINQPVSIVARAARTLQPVILNNVRENPAWLPNPDLPDVQSEMAIPVISQEKLLIGVLNIHADQLNAFDDNDSAIMTTLATQIGAAIQNTRLFELSQVSEANARKSNEELAVLNALSKELTKLLSLNEISELTYKYTSQLMDTSSFFMCLLDNEKQEMSWPLLIEDGEKLETSPRKLQNGLSDYVIRTNQSLYIPEHMPERREEIGADNLLIGSPADAKSWLGVPMSIGDRVLGALVVQSIHQENLHTEHHRDLLLAIAQQTAVALENSRLFELSQASEANFRNLVENAPEAIIVVDMTTGLITDPNENAE
ncbi:MAG: GAF domain-containing protein, partial [Anaerolineales bacterium]|nr:GAF domain-containing protein [Anaerolineales bacterium]